MKHGVRQFRVVGARYIITSPESNAWWNPYEKQRRQSRCCLFFLQWTIRSLVSEVSTALLVAIYARPCCSFPYLTDFSKLVSVRLSARSIVVRIYMANSCLFRSSSCWDCHICRRLLTGFFFPTGMCVGYSFKLGPRRCGRKLPDTDSTICD